VEKRGIMHRRVLALCIAAAILAPAPSAFAQGKNQQPQPPKRSKAEQADIEALSSAVDFAAVGKPATDVTVKWEMSHFMRNPDGSTVFPFVVSVDKTTLPGNEAAVYMRVMDKEQIAALTRTRRTTSRRPLPITSGRTSISSTCPPTAGLPGRLPYPPVSTSCSWR
jgi:hypothetical protein